MISILAVSYFLLRVSLSGGGFVGGSPASQLNIRAVSSRSHRALPRRFAFAGDRFALVGRPLSDQHAANYSNGRAEETKRGDDSGTRSGTRSGVVLAER